MGARVWMTSYPEEMGREFEDFKNMSVEGWHWTMQADEFLSYRWELKVDIGPRRQTVEFSAIGA